MITLHIKNVENLRKIYESSNNRIIYSGIVNIKDLLDGENTRIIYNLKKEFNPRDAKISSQASKDMVDTIKDQPGEFIFRNRGLTFMVSSLEWDNKTNDLKVLFDRDTEEPKPKFGLLDGGHTFQVLQTYMDEIVTEDQKELSDVFIRLEFLEGFKSLEDEILPVIYARNTSTQVKERSKANLAGKFKLIEEAIKEKSYSSNIAYKENQLRDENDFDSGYRTIAVEEVISYINVFDFKAYNEDRHPTSSYSGKSKMLDRISDIDPKLVKKTSDILELHDYIESKIFTWWGSVSTRFADQKGVKKLKTQKQLNFSDYKTEYSIPAGYVYPILAALRVLLDENYQWILDPKKVLDEISEKLIMKIRNLEGEDRNPNAMGKNTGLYQACYDVVDKYLLKTIRVEK